MKTKLIKYLVASSPGYWGAIDLYNDSTAETTATIKIQRYVTGDIGRTLTKTILPKRHVLITPAEIASGLISADEGRCTLILSISDDTHITAYQGCVGADGVTTSLLDVRDVDLSGTSLGN